MGHRDSEPEVKLNKGSVDLFQPLRNSVVIHIALSPESLAKIDNLAELAKMNRPEVIQELISGLPSKDDMSHGMIIATVSLLVEAEVAKFREELAAIRSEYQVDELWDSEQLGSWEEGRDIQDLKYLANSLNEDFDSVLSECVRSNPELFKILQKYITKTLSRHHSQEAIDQVLQPDRV